MDLLHEGIVIIDFSPALVNLLIECAHLVASLPDQPLDVLVYTGLV